MSNFVMSDDILLRQKAVIELLKQVIEPTLKNDVISLGIVTQFLHDVDWGN